MVEHKDSHVQSNVAYTVVKKKIANLINLFLNGNPNRISHLSFLVIVDENKSSWFHLCILQYSILS